MKPSFKASQDLLVESTNTAHENLDMNEYNNRILPLQSSVCALLCEQRNKLNITLKKVSDDLRIAESYLYAIENADITILPERVYTLGFVRSYAQYLDLEPYEIIQRFKTEILGDAVNANYSMPQPVIGNALPNRWLIWSTSIIVVGGIILGWIYYALDTPALTKSHTIPAIIKDDIKEHTNNITLMQNTPTPVELLNTFGVSPLVNMPDQHHEKTDVIPKDTHTLDTAHNVIKDQQLNATQPTLAKPTNVITNDVQYTTLPNPGHIQLKFTALSWVEIRDQYGTTIVNRNFKAGEYYDIQLRPGLVLSTGNAGGLDIVLPSNHTFSLGKHGEVIHNINLNSERFQTNS